MFQAVKINTNFTWKNFNIK